MRRSLLGAFLIAPCLFVASHLATTHATPEVQASVSVQLSLTQLTTFSDSVAVGTSVDSHSAWEAREDGGQRIVTYHRLRVERTVFGGGSSEVWVRTLGGTVGNIGQRVDGEAVLPRNQRVLLFLKKHQDNAFFVTGLGQGVYHVERSADGVERLRRSLSGGTILPRALSEPPLPSRTLDDVVASIRTIRAAHVQ